MFGKLFRHPIATTLILLGLCAYVIRLFLTQTIGLYIHPRYSWFAVIMCSIAAIILVGSLVADLRRRHHHAIPGNLVVTIVVAVMMVLALVLPARTLSPATMSQRTLKTLNYDGTPLTKACPDEQPGITRVWIDEMSQYPLWCYEGKTVELTGFIFEPPDSPLPDTMYYLGQMVMSCCAIDMQPYGLPILKRDGDMFMTDTWLTVRGTTKKMHVQGREQLVVEPATIDIAQKPSNPYRYIQQLGS